MVIFQGYFHGLLYPVWECVLSRTQTQDISGATNSVFANRQNKNSGPSRNNRSTELGVAQTGPHRCSLTSLPLTRRWLWDISAGYFGRIYWWRLCDSPGRRPCGLQRVFRRMLMEVLGKVVPCWNHTEWLSGRQSGLWQWALDLTALMLEY